MLQLPSHLVLGEVPAEESWSAMMFEDHRFFLLCSITSPIGASCKALLPAAYKPVSQAA